MSDATTPATDPTPVSRRRPAGPLGYALDALVLLTFLALIAVAFPRYIKARDGWREDEVRANLKVIQVALERYGVDHGGMYPLILYGGHPSDTFATSRAPEVSEFPGDVDWLMEEGYLEEYPQNPFRRGSREPLKVRAIEELPDQCLPEKCYTMRSSSMPRSRVNVWWKGGTRGDPDRSRQRLERMVGGPRGDLMWDVSEGQRHTPFPICLGTTSGDVMEISKRNWPDTLNPRSCERLDDHEPHTHFLLPGNFYYLATFTGIGNYNSFTSHSPDETRVDPEPFTGTVTGYTLFGYGGAGSMGQDGYNHWGDTSQRNFMLQGFESYYAGEGHYMGPDGRPDGVVEQLGPPATRPYSDLNANE